MADGKPTAIVRGMDPAEHIVAPAQLEHTPRSHSVDQEDSINKDAVSEKGDYAVGPVSASASEGEFEAGLSTTRVGGLTEAERQALLRSDPTLSADPPIASKIIDYIVPRRVRKGRRPKRDPDSTATQPSVFDIPELCAVYEPPDEWENKKNWDPSLRWTWREEAAVIRKVDLNVFAWCAFFFAILNLDRSNLTSANAAGFLPDSHLTKKDFNDGQTIFYVSFLCAEMPGQLLSKRMGPDRFIPCQMFAWGVVTACQFFIKGRTSFFVLRALLGLTQGSFIPDILLLLSFFYRGSELTTRLALFWCTLNFTMFISNYINLAFLQIHTARYPSPYWVFLLGGLITILVSFVAMYVMPASPSQTTRPGKSYGFLDERQSKIAVARILRDEPQKSSMHNRQGLDHAKLWRAVKNWRMWPLYVIGVTFSLPTAPIQSYLTINLSQLGFSTVLTQTLSSVNNLVQIFTGLAVALLSEHFNERTYLCMTEDMWAWPCLVALLAMKDGDSRAHAWSYYAVVTAALSAPYVHAVQASWVSANSGDVATRTVATSLYNIAIQITFIISSQVYQPSDKGYRKANAALLAICTFNFFLYTGTKLFYITLNRRRDRIWGRMSASEKAHYINTTEDKGNERLDFRFVH